MKHLVIGDQATRANIWKEIIKRHTFDKVVLTGDYLADAVFEPNQTFEAFNELLEYKKANPDRVVLLLGDRDFGYVWKTGPKPPPNLDDYTDDLKKVFAQINYQAGFMLHEAFEQGLIQICYRHKNTLFTHAGISKKWLAEQHYQADTPIDAFINDLFKRNPLAFKRYNSNTDPPVAQKPTESPLHIRSHRFASEEHLLEGYKQIVGHTSEHQLDFYDQKTDFLAVYVNALWHTGDYITLSDEGKVSVHRIEITQ